MTPGEEAYQQYVAKHEDPITVPAWDQLDDYARRMWEIGTDAFSYAFPTAGQRAFPMDWPDASGPRRPKGG